LKQQNPGFFLKTKGVIEKEEQKNLNQTQNYGDKRADFAGPGVSTYEEVEKILPNDYEPLLPPLERMKALFAVKEYIERTCARN
jgi:hypothetical protein